MSAAQQECLAPPVECVVTIDGKEITPYYRYLREVTVTATRKGATECSLALESVREENGDWIVQDEEWFIPWRKLRIEAHFGSRKEEVMRGYIRNVNIQYPQDMGAATVTVHGQDETLLLDREHPYKPWSREKAPRSDGDIARRIANEHGFKADVKPGLMNRSISSDRTPIRLLRDRAAANGFELYVRSGTLYFGPPQLDGTPQPTIMVYAGRLSNCVSFSVNHDGHKPDRIRLTRAAETGAKSKDKIFSPNLSTLGRKIASSENMGLAPFTWVLQRHNAPTSAEAKSRAQAKANENAWKLSADGELDGVLYRHVLLTHRTVEVDGVGGVYGGLYYVDEVRHTFSSDGYMQRFKLLRNATGEQAKAAKADKLAAVKKC